MKATIEHAGKPSAAPALPAIEFHLSSQSAGSEPPTDGAPSNHAGPADGPSVVALGASSLSWHGRTAISLQPTGLNLPSPTAFLEPLLSRPADPRLLLVSPPGATLRVNGAPAPRLTLLSEGDRFHFDAGPLISVSVFYRPQLGPVPSNLVGTPCAVCSLALAAGDRCLVCSCSTPMHAAEDESQPGALACVKMVSLCPHCQSPVRLVPGYGERSAINELSHPHE